MVKVPWEKLAESPRASEALIAMLVIRLRSRAQEVDGTGGDRGRDIFEYTEDYELINYEVKSFTGRMTPGRRRQVKDSLISSARHQPDHWDLLVPITPNPAEQNWFDGLREKFPFVRYWRGRLWLDQQFARHDDLVRYALHESSDYILERVAELRAERDVMLRGIPDLLDRYGALVRRAQEISPHYTIHTTAGPDGEPTVTLTPRTPNAPPVTFTGRFQFQQNDPADERRRQQLEDAVRFGDTVELAADNLGEMTISAPPSLGIADTFTPNGVRITAVRQDLDPPRHAQLSIQQPSGIPIASLPLTFSQRTVGLEGGTLFGQDFNRFLHVKVRMDRQGSGQLTLSFDPPGAASPQALVPGLRLLSHARPGRFMELDFGQGTPLRMPVPPLRLPAGWDADEAQRWADAFEDLAKLQSQTGIYFPIPDDFTMRDAQEVKDVVALLDGEHVIMKADTVTLDVISSEGLERLADMDRFRVAVHGSLQLTLGAHVIQLGPYTDVVIADSVLNLREARRHLDQDGRATVQLRIAEDTPPVRYLGTDHPEDESSPSHPA